MELSSRKTGVTGKTCIFEPHKPIQIFPSSSICSVNELLCDTSWVQHGEKNLLQPRKGPWEQAGRRSCSPCGPQRGCRGCSSTLPCNTVRFIFRSYQQFTVGCSLQSRMHPSISWHGHIAACTEVTVQLC